MLVKIIVSSLLILGVLVIRSLFQKKVNPIYIYALWLPVAIRLLMPGMPVDTPLSIMHTGAWERGSALLKEENDRQKDEFREKQYRKYLEEAEAFARSEKTPEPEIVHYELKWQLAGTFFERIRQIGTMIWLTGMVLLSLIFFWQNIFLYRYLHATGKKLLDLHSGEKGAGGDFHLKRPVFTAGDKLASPCLFELFPSVYIPGKALEENKEETLSIILAHELTHYRHLDHVWALVRVLCLIINWYNPLVWIGAKLSLRDGELACDAGCIGRLGEEKRFAYGDALLSMVKPVNERKGFFCHTILMVSEKKFMKKRIENIAKNRRGSRAAMLAMLIIIFFCAGCTCTGKTEEETEQGSRTTQTAGDTAKAEMVFLNNESKTDVIKSNEVWKEIPDIRGKGEEAAREILRKEGFSVTFLVITSFPPKIIFP